MRPGASLTGGEGAPPGGITAAREVGFSDHQRKTGIETVTVASHLGEVKQSEEGLEGAPPGL
jgi:hypothetical protein